MEFKILKETEEAEMKACQLAETTKKKETEKARERERKQMEELLAHRHQEEIKFKKSIEAIEELVASEGTKVVKHLVGAIKNPHKRLEDRMISCERAQEDYISSLIDKEVVESESHWIATTLGTYNKACNEVEIFISRNGTEKEASTSYDKPGAGSAGIKLEKVKFDPFRGNLRKYTTFKEEFLKHIKPLYKPSEQAFVLRSYLSDEIKEEIEGLGEDTKQIWKRLDEKYGDQGKLVDAITSEIKKLGKSVNEDPKGTIEMIKIIERAHRDLKSMGLKKEISNSTIVSMIEERLPEAIEKEWIQTVTNKLQPEIIKDKFPALLDLLLEFRERIEYKFSDLRSGSSEMGHTLLANRGIKEEKPRCWMHPNHHGHPIWKCIAFENKSAAEKIRLVRENEACFKCLEQGHTTKSCKRKFKCKEDGCGMPHHQMLHEAHASGISFYSEEVFSMTESRDTEILLQLQKLKGKKRGGNWTSLNTLWDDGSMLSFITFHQAERMNLSGRRVNLQIVKVGGAIEELESCRYDLTLIDKASTVITISVLGIDRISTDITPIEVSRVIKLLEGVGAQDLDRPEEGEIDCLIGYEYAAFHPVRKQAAGHLLLLEHRFAMTIGGTNPTLKERTRKVLQHGTVHHAMVRVEDFYKLEQLGVECTPKCGSCKCGQCHPGGKSTTLKEEQEYKMIEDKLTYKPN